ncbi:hypothetical protein PSTT_00059 [Puccinia striiformis]|uniref:Alpha-type protein kinase domain-containing protein n=1 Tax=Puccinia striiformis TaxID=27350 RepID=A0A2S4W7U8_9BASI|nr:hypothetical protein PSTT_00059 [Puccinia striiformis]
MSLKLNKHCDGVNPEIAQLMDGFTHWSYVHTDGESLISDLQGVGPTLTDPQIISCDPNLWADGSNSTDGIKQFLQNHECNPVCQAFGHKHPNNPNAIPSQTIPIPSQTTREKPSGPDQIERHPVPVAIGL